MADEEKNGAVPPKVKLKINTPGADNNASADSGPATIKIKPIKKVVPKTPVVAVAEDVDSKPKSPIIILKEPVDTPSVKVDLKPVNKKSETSKISLGSAVPKPITISKKTPVVKEDSSPAVANQEAKSQTSRISLTQVLSSVDEQSAQPVAPTSRPKTVKLKRPVVAPKVTPSLEPMEEGITPTRKKTIRTRRPAAASTPTVDLSAGEPSGPKLQTNVPQAGGAYIADRFSNLGPIEAAEDKPHWVFAVVGVLACVIMVVTIYVQVAQMPNSGLAWVGQILQDQF
jgi:hypothetical protein